VKRIEGDSEFRGITVERVADGTERRIDADGMFIAIGLEPENQAFGSLAKLDERGYFASGEDCLTDTAGVFVAGDCRGKAIRQVATAVSDGAVAALAACRYLDE